MNTRWIERTVADVLGARTEMAFAYLHGSVLTSDSPRDVDIAVFLEPDYEQAMRQTGRLQLDVVLPLEMDLERVLSMPVDVQALNHAPLSFRARVANQGRVVLDRNSTARCDFECRARCEYFDFRPRRQEYLAALGVA